MLTPFQCADQKYLKSIDSSRIQGLTGQRATGERESQLSGTRSSKQADSTAAPNPPLSAETEYHTQLVHRTICHDERLERWASSERRFCMEFSSKNRTLLKILGSLPVSFTNDTLADFWGNGCPKDPIMMMTNLFEDHQLFVLLPTQHFFLTQWIRRAL